MKLFDDYPRLEDERLVLRKMTAADAPALSLFAKKESLYTYLPTFLYEQKYEDAEEMLAKMDEECFQTKQSLFLGIYLKSGAGAGQDGQFAGIAEIYGYEKKKQKASLGVRLDPDFWGQGIATAATNLLKRYLLEDTDIRTITLHIMQANHSDTTAKKCGFVLKYPDLLEDWGMPELVKTDKYVYKKEWDTASGDSSGADGQPMHVEQFVMAYRAEQDRIRALLPDGFTSLRPVLRINTEIQNDKRVYVEFNTPVEARGRRGWLNIANWKSPADPVTFEREGGTVRITAPFLTLTYTGNGMEGGCPAEKDNEGCYFNVPHDTEFRPAETVTENKEFCDCAFAWRFREGDASGRSEGRTIPAYETPVSRQYEKCDLTAEHAAAIPCEQVLGAYIVRFERRRGR